MEDTARSASGQPPSDIMISIRDLEKVYSNGSNTVAALKGINLDIPRGSIFGIIGLSGAGKSTLIRCINRLDPPTGGQILIDGVDIMKLNNSELLKTRRQLGMIFQQFNLLMQRTILANVMFPMEISGVPKAQAKKRAQELLDIVSLGNKANVYPAQLSGGQKQRVAIARALTMEPKVLLCDEATSALDPMTTRSILALLQDINKRLGITIVVITHEMEVIRQICTDVAIIDGGVIAEHGRVRDVFTHPKTEAAKRLFRKPDEEEMLPDRPCVRILFEGADIYEPVISGMTLASGAPVSIYNADIRRVGGQVFGQLVVELPSDPAAAKRCREYLASHKELVVEEVRGNDME